MAQVSLNHITRSVLSQKQLPIHYYYRFLKYASDGFRELLFDVLQVTNTVRLPVNDLNEATIPGDYVDWVKIGVQSGQFVRPLISKESINNLANFDTDDGSQIAYPEPETDEDLLVGYYNWLGENTNTHGEDMGGYYGVGAGVEPDTFKVIRERGVIQLNQRITETKIVLQYLGDGSSVNAVSTVEPYAQKTIECYIDWQYKLHSKSFGQGDHKLAEQEFYTQLRKLIGRKNKLTPDSVERIINRARKATIQ